MNFEQLKLKPELLRALQALGYETPTPIQERTIPVLLNGEDLLAQAQTGTGKTAAFALPILQNLDVKNLRTQALILAPTRELAIQVAEALQSYAKFCTGFHVLPIYGGQDFGPQIRALKRGVHIVVGTPGRIMDHLRRGNLSIQNVKTVVLDEADEMLKMGFIDDVEWILEQIKVPHQTALFSATLPTSIQNIAGRYLKNPQKIRIQSQESSPKAIKQFFVEVYDKNKKIEMLSRFLEVEPFDAVIIFTRTKNASAEVAEKLAARGYAAAAINGDMSQRLREQVIKQLKNKTLDIVVATDVAARGLDVERISFVVNFDIPYDVESYVHRIGRTGRAGREGKALLLVHPRERRMLREIENVTRHRLLEMKPPSQHALQEKRLAQLAEKISAALHAPQLDEHRNFIKQLVTQHGWNELDVAAAIFSLSQKTTPAAVEEKKEVSSEPERPRFRKKFRRHEHRKRSPA